MLNCNRNKGFTIVEIIISIAILSLIITLLVVNINFLNRFILRSEVDKLASTLVYIQRCAILNGKDQILEFDIKNRLYKFDEKIFKLPRQVEFGFCQDVKGPPSAPSLVIKFPVTFKNNKIIFYGDGIIDSGTIYITDLRKQFMYAISSGVAQTSYIRKYIYNFSDTGKWALIK
ncbi:MAG: hypothetical protein UR12_C0006G0025 [candidate division TM6 bacterium GW2011_GWF2_30_66]|jgi:prepilin-type N-terminal cleavage/methylation domain-containing protein|nr:MAG: hypothetical protein UR12_C0006G0025 [candidate division TM6 bacterium GW2011_GWF2_30_66]